MLVASGMVGVQGWGGGGGGVAPAFRDEKTRYKRLLFSSPRNRAIQTANELSSFREDIVLKDYLMGTDREDFRDHDTFLGGLQGLADYYKADYVIVIGHGDMPALFAETLNKSISGNLSQSCEYPQNGCGFAVNMDDGSILPINTGMEVAKELAVASKNK